MSTTPVNQLTILANQLDVALALISEQKVHIKKLESERDNYSPSKPVIHPPVEVNETPLTQDELIETIRRRHPTILVSPLSDYSKKYGEQDGVWLRGDEEDADTPVICDLSCDQAPGYEAYISTVFTDWLWVNGWHCECFDYGSYMLLPAEELFRNDPCFKKD